jgi:SAM-dependent methyltransferase
MQRALTMLSVGVFLLSCRPNPVAGTSDASTSTPTIQGTLDEAAVKAMSHALLEADARGDATAFSRATAPNFVLFEKSQVRARDDLLKGLRARAEHPGPARVLTYPEEHVSIGASSAVFIGEVVERSPANGARPAADVDGWSTLVWVREDGQWKATIWQWARAGLDGSREEWNATFREGTAFNSEPSKFLTEIVAGRKPGAALDVGMGQGRNALYLASQGWNVTGIDISDEGLRQAREAAAKRHLSVETINTDVAAWDFGVEKWDLVALIYSGCDEKMVARLRSSLKKGGLVVVDGFHKDPGPGLGFETGQLSALFRDGFTVLRDDVVEDVSDWGRQRQKLTRFAAEKR